MFFIGLASDLQDVDKKTHRPTKLISQGKQVGYFYDKHGRVKTKTLVPIDKNGNEIPQSTHNLVGYRESLQLFYSPNHELIESITIKDEGLKVVKTVTHYYYDAFGRRIGKSSSTQKSSKLNQRGQLVRFPSNLSSLNTTDRPQRKNTLMLWDGNRQIQEITDDFTFTTVYEQNSFVPVARIVERQPHLLEQAKLDEQAEWAKYENMTLSPKAKANIHHKAHTGLRIYHYHTDHLGTPQELTNERGEVVWLNYQMAWGGSFSQLNHVHNLDGLDVSSDELQPFRFQGQFFDGETNLHYNRFRYYDSDVGMFISRDPIGLLGGSNVFQYAPNPIGWIDPWGLNRFTPTTWKSTAEGGTGYQYKVYQQPIDWDLKVNTRDGVKTNLELAEIGRSPFVVKDGKYSLVNLHHSKQNAKGSLFELSSATHQKYHGSNALHPYLPKPHPINPVPDVRENFNIDRKEYWMDRAKAERIKRNSMNPSKC